MATVMRSVNTDGDSLRYGDGTGIKGHSGRKEPTGSGIT